MIQCKITVLKRIYNKDLCDNFFAFQVPDSFSGCPFFKEGQEFFVKGHNQLPENFCAWAWADIQKDVLTVMFGGSFPWMKQKNMNIACCSDGLMPVVFKVERIEEKIKE